MTITVAIVGLILILFLIGKVNLSIQFGREVKELFAQSKSISERTFHKTKLDSLPEPVQRYFNHILKEDQPYISYARIKHNGQFKTGLDKG